jgi:hypothetical protein
MSTANAKTLIGLPEMQRKFREAPGVFLAELKVSNRTTAQLIKARARMAAAKVRRDLEQAIDIVATGREFKVGILDRDVPGRGGKNTAHRNPSVYGPWSEYGRPGQRAKPFMRPSADGQRRDHGNRTIQAIRAAERKLSAGVNTTGGQFL